MYKRKIIDEVSVNEMIQMRECRHPRLAVEIVKEK